MSAAGVRKDWIVNGRFDVERLAGLPLFRFDLTPVLERSNRSLLRNPERLQLMCEQHVVRLVPGDMVLFEGTGFFLAVQSCGGAAAIALANQVNVALLRIFFGTDSLIAAELAPLFRAASPIEILQAGAPDSPADASAAPQPEKTASRPVETDPLARLANSGVPGYDGLRLGFVPIYGLRRAAPSTFLCAPARLAKDGGPAQLATLGGIDPKDRPSLDEAMLEHSLVLARQTKKANVTAAIGAPVSFETLASPRGRRLYQLALRGADIAADPFVVIKIEDVPAGTPASRLAEILSVVRPLARHVFLQLADTDVRLMESGNLGATGLYAKLPVETTAFGAARTASFVVRNAGLQRACSYVEGVANAALLRLVRDAAVRFASGAVFGSEVLTGNAPLHCIEALAQGRRASSSRAA